MSLVRLELSPLPRVQRVFGISLIATGIVLGLILHLAAGASTAALIVGIACLVLGVVPLVATDTAAARAVWVFVSVPALIVGNVFSVVLVTAFFYLMITPIGLILRLARKDPLRLAPSDAPSHWIETDGERPPESYERQF